MGGGGSAGNKPTPQEASAASNGANRPALMVSIDLQQAGRTENQLDSCPMPAQEAQRGSEDSSDSGVLRLKSKTDGDIQIAPDGRPEVIKQQKSCSEARPETPKHKQDSRRDSSGKQSSDKRPESSKHRHDSKPDKIRPETLRKPDGRPEVSRDGREEKHKDRERSSDGSKIRRPDTPKSSSRSDQERSRDKERDRERKNRPDSREHRDRRSPEHRPRPDSPRVKLERGNGSDGSGRPRTDLKSPSSKEERRSSDGHRKSTDSSKPPSSESKVPEFPDYLLGGKSGALKNFVIPKLKRDKDGKEIKEERDRKESRDGRDRKDGNPDIRRSSEMVGQPLVKLERLGLEDITKRPKPIVVLQKLSIDEVQKIIKDRHLVSSKSSKHRPSYGKSSKGKSLICPGLSKSCTFAQCQDDPVHWGLFKEPGPS